MELLMICIKVFFARIIDVCLGAFRTVNIVRGHRVIAAAIVFVEILIWYSIAKEVLISKNISFAIPLAYAGGYATGTYLGTYLSSILTKGYLTIHIISSKITDKDVEKIKNKGYGLSTLNTTDNKLLLIIEINKKKLNHLRILVNKLDKNAFMIINETKYINNGFIK